MRASYQNMIDDCSIWHAVLVTRTTRDSLQSSWPFTHRAILCVMKVMKCNKKFVASHLCMICSYISCISILLYLLLYDKLLF